MSSLRGFVTRPIIKFLKFVNNARRRNRKKSTPKNEEKIEKIISSGITTSPNQMQTLNADCMYEVFKNLRNDYKSLLSCMLVCHFWCENALPFYWEEPFQHLEHRLIIASFLACLSEEERNVLSSDVIKLPQLERPLKIDYTSYLRSLSAGTLYSAVKTWIEHEKRQSYLGYNSCDRISLLHEHILQVCYPLCNQFMSNGSNILSLSLDWDDMDFWKKYPSAPDLFGDTTSLSNLKELSIHYINNWSIFKHLAKSAQNIENLEIVGYSLFPSPKRSEEEDLAELIKKQRRLRQFKLFGYGTTPTNTINSIVTQAKTLSCVEIIYVHFGGNGALDGPSLAGLATCFNLEELKIRHCTFANDSQLMPLATASFPALRKIHFVESTYAWDKAMVSLIRNNPTHLGEVFFKPSTDGLAIQYNKPYSTEIVEVVAKLCPNLTALGVPIGWGEMDFLEQILSNPSCQLRSLSLFPTSRWTGKQIADRWPSFGPLMPTTLQHLNVFMKMSDESMKQFLQSTHAPLQTLWFESWLYVTGNICLIVHEFLDRRPGNGLGLKQGARKFLRYVV